MDKDTADILQEGEKVYDFAQSEMWQWAKDRLQEKIRAFVDIRNIDAKGDSVAILREVQARQAVVDMVEQWIADIEGRASKYKNQDSRMVEEEKQDIIFRDGE